MLIVNKFKFDRYLEGKNKHSHEELSGLVNNKKLKLKNFGWIDIDFELFDWKEDSSPVPDNNFWWQLQSFRFLLPFLNSHSLLDSNDKEFFFKKSLVFFIGGKVSVSMPMKVSCCGMIMLQGFDPSD